MGQLLRYYVYHKDIGEKAADIQGVNKMDYYSIFTKLVEKYGEPDTFSPQAATWKDDDVTMSLEKPLTLKYIDNKIFEQTQNYSNIQKSPTEITREMFLDGL